MLPLSRAPQERGSRTPGPSPTYFLLQIRKPRLLPHRSQQGLSPTAELASYQAQGGCHGPQLGITVDPREGHRGPPFPLGTCACWLRPQGTLQRPVEPLTPWRIIDAGFQLFTPTTHTCIVSSLWGNTVYILDNQGGSRDWVARQKFQDQKGFRTRSL